MNFSGYNTWMSYLGPILQGLQGGTPNLSGNYRTPYTNGYPAANVNSFADTLRQAQNTQNTNTLQVPQSMDAIFEEAARTYHLPVNFLKAVGKAESDFNPNDVSGAGAQGVMQLMPETARYLGVTDPFDPRQNIMGGAKYLAEMLNRFNGNKDLALAAYNAGPNAVEKYGGIPPYKETQNYVRIVNEYMNGDLTTGQTVNASLPAANTESVNPLQNGWNGGMCCCMANAMNNPLMGMTANRDTALYMIEMMKMQIQMQGAFGSGNDSSGGFGI